MKREKTLLIWISALALSAGMAACGDTDTPDPVDTGSDAGTDVQDTTDVEPQGTCTDTIQNNGETEVDCGGPNCRACETVDLCTNGVIDTGEEAIDCGGDCDPCPEVCTDDGSAGCATSQDCTTDGSTCNRGTHCCEAAPVPACSVDEQVCTEEAQSTDRFICDMGAGLCLRRCNAETADDTGSDDCPARAWCLPLQGDDETAGACVPGDCSSLFEGCETEDAAGTCFPVGNAASFCLPGGTQMEGQSCAGENESCEAGLLCGLDQTCFAPCNINGGTEGAQCYTAGGETCVEALDNTASNPVGICGVACADFSTGECGDEMCTVTLGRGGMNDSICQPTEGTPVDFGEACTDASLCAEGSVCIGDVCTQLCDTANAAAEAVCAGDGDLCQPSAIDGLGFCVEACTPYPRLGAGNYECAGADDSCNPFGYDGGTTWADSLGGCIDPPNADIAYGASCGGADMMYNYCGSDLGLCFDSNDVAPNPTCREFCSPFSDDAACGDDAACTRGFALFTGSEFGFCSAIADTVADGDEGDACTEAQYLSPCTGAGTTCMPVSQTDFVCTVICRMGEDDCGSGTCSAAPFQGLPAYMGYCR